MTALAVKVKESRKRATFSRSPACRGQIIAVGAQRDAKTREFLSSVESRRSFGRPSVSSRRACHAQVETRGREKFTISLPKVAGGN